MTDSTKTYIQTVTIPDIPWHRLTTTYGRATNFPKYLKTLGQMENRAAIQAAGEEIALNIEHQSTLWHATPFALIFLGRTFARAVEQKEQSEAARYLAEELLELFMEIAEALLMAEELTHAEPLPNFADLLKEEYLWSEEYDEDADELRYEEEDVFPADLFYSFYYYSRQVLLLCRPWLRQLGSEAAQALAEKLKD